MNQLGYAGWLAAFMLLTLLVSNGARSLGVPFYISRKVAHFGAAVPLLLAPVFFQDLWFPLSLSLASLFLLAATHNYDLFPGFAKKGRWSEVAFPFSIALSLGLLWRADPWAAVVPGLWLALGDGITGLVRYVTLKREKKGWWGSLACFVVCAVIGAVLIHPMWAGILGAATATIAERYCGDAEGALLHLDDNLVMPIAGLAIIAVVVL